MEQHNCCSTVGSQDTVTESSVLQADMERKGIIVGLFDPFTSLRIAITVTHSRNRVVFIFMYLFIFFSLATEVSLQLRM